MQSTAREEGLIMERIFMKSAKIVYLFTKCKQCTNVLISPYLHQNFQSESEILFHC